MNDIMEPMISTIESENNQVIDANDIDYAMELFHRYLDNQALTIDSTVEERNSFIVGLNKLFFEIELAFKAKQVEDALKVFKSENIQILTETETELPQIVLSNTKQRLSTILSVNKVKNANHLPTMMTGYLRLQSLSNKKINHDEEYKKPNDAKLILMYMERPLFWQNVTNKAVSWNKKFNLIMKPSTLGALFALLSEKDEEKNEVKADLFMEQMCTGLNYTNQAIVKLRKKILDDTTASVKMTFPHQNAVIIKAWNAFKNDDNSKQSPIDLNEIFPVTL